MQRTMNIIRWLTLTALLTAVLPCGAAGQEPSGDKWEQAIAAFEAEDLKSPPAEGGVVFVGSSSIRRWDLAKSFPDLPAINRGFGGSQLADSVRYAARIVNPYRPKTVVLYAGDNDIAAGKSPEQVADDFAAFVKRVRGGLPAARIVFVAIKPSAARWKDFPSQKEANRLIQGQCAAGSDLVFVDVVKPMLGDNGRPKSELFATDQLHLSEAGYQLWAKLLIRHLW